MRYPARIFLAALLAALMWGCGGSTSKRPSDGAEPAPAEQSRSVNDILAAPVDHNILALDSYAEKIMTGADLNDADVASMIVLAEATASHIQQEVAALSANDDDADAFNVLTEFGSAPWIRSFSTVFRFLSESDFPEVFRPRIVALVLTVSRINSEIASIGDRRFAGRRFLTL